MLIWLGCYRHYTSMSSRTSLSVRHYQMAYSAPLGPTSLVCWFHKQDYNLYSRAPMSASKVSEPNWKLLACLSSLVRLPYNDSKLRLARLTAQATISIAPLETFRAALQVTRRFDFAPPDWTTTLLSTMATAREVEDDLSIITLLLSELCNPPNIEMTQGYDDPLVPMAALLLGVTSQRDGPLIETLLERNLPILLDGHSQMFILNNPQPLVKAIRLSMVLLDVISPGLAKRVADRLVEELLYQRSRPSAEQRDSNGPLKRPATGVRQRPNSGTGKTTVDMLIKALDDEELKVKWSSLSRLST